jgi:hypothetical protein
MCRAARRCPLLPYDPHVEWYPPTGVPFIVRSRMEEIEVELTFLAG